MKKNHDQEASDTRSSGNETFAISAIFNAAAIICSYGEPFGEFEIGEVVIQMLAQQQSDKLKDKSTSEKMLINQAQALQSIFTNLSLRAYDSDIIDNFDRYMRLALKAQAQCTRTLEALNSLQNPNTVSLVQQTNIGAAVQVNNAPENKVLCEQKENQKNELLEVKDVERLDTREASKTIKINQGLAAMEQVYRAEDKRRQE